jgi:hypothetical protein
MPPNLPITTLGSAGAVSGVIGAHLALMARTPLTPARASARAPGRLNRRSGHRRTHRRGPAGGRCGRPHDGCPELLRKQLEADCPDVIRAMLERVAEQLMSAEADAPCGAGDGERSPERVTKETATGPGAGTPGRERSSWRSPSCGKGPTSRLALGASPPRRAGAHDRQLRRLPGQGLHPPGGQAGAAPWPSRGSRTARSRRSPGACTRRSRPSALARWRVLTPTSGSTPWWYAAATSASG